MKADPPASSAAPGSPFCHSERSGAQRNAVEESLTIGFFFGAEIIRDFSTSLSCAQDKGENWR